MGGGSVGNTRGISPLGDVTTKKSSNGSAATLKDSRQDIAKSLKMLRPENNKENVPVNQQNNTVTSSLQVLKETIKDKAQRKESSIIGGLKKLIGGEYATSKLNTIADGLNENSSFKQLKEAKEELLQLKTGKRATQLKADLLEQIETQLSTIAQDRMKGIVSIIERETTNEGNLLRSNDSEILDMAESLSEAGKQFKQDVASETTTFNSARANGSSPDRFSGSKECEKSLNAFMTILTASADTESPMTSMLQDLNNKMKDASIGGHTSQKMNPTQRGQALKSFVFLRVLTPAVVTNNAGKMNDNSKMMAKLIQIAANSNNGSVPGTVWEKFESTKEYNTLKDKGVNMSDLKKTLGQIAGQIDEWMESIIGEKVS